MIKVAADWINSETSRRICALFEDAGHEAYFVGGCVRNALLNAPVSDLDISTSALPQETLELAEKAGIKAIPTGIEHGTITLVEDGIPFEVTTFRKDVETNGRHAVVSFSKSMKEDAKRRDFTMNALYVDVRGTVFDPIGGVPDLQQGHVRFIGSPSDRIKEDYLRILRFFRFTAWYGNPDLGIDPEALAACAEYLDGIDGLSSERIGHEMRKLLSAPNPAPVLGAMAQTGVLLRVLSGSDPVSIAVLVHLETGSEPDPIVRLAALGGEGAKERLRLSNSEAKRLSLVSEESCETKSIGELAYRFGAKEARNIVLVRSARMRSELPKNLDRDIARGADAQFPIKAVDLMGTYSGAALGAQLRKLESAWIASNFTQTREALLSL